MIMTFKLINHDAYTTDFISNCGEVFLGFDRAKTKKWFVVRFIDGETLEVCNSYDEAVKWANDNLA